ncbi:MAG: protein phosphatase 2C domain-containing protein, partial [Candidatus Subteraquimicrobiales bacterium]|nr:protein phosphatase 2C domain-containing protein [Candidatus Subteraquimicrobiales bacterium]
MGLRYAAESDIGRLREINEDAYLAEDNLFAVADGLGGHQSGEVASFLAVKTLKETNEGLSETSPEILLTKCFEQANSAVFQSAFAEPEQFGMGTTLTCVLISNRDAFIAHAGDSRAYLFRENTLKKLTQDHTLVAQMVREGRLSEEEMLRHPQRNILTKALGVDSKIEPDVISLKLKPKEKLLLCTDGLTT